MDKVLVWFDGKVCGEYHIIYNLKKKCKCGEKK